MTCTGDPRAGCSNGGGNLTDQRGRSWIYQSVGGIAAVPHLRSLLLVTLTRLSFALLWQNDLAPVSGLGWEKDHHRQLAPFVLEWQDLEGLWRASAQHPARIYKHKTRVVLYKGLRKLSWIPLCLCTSRTTSAADIVLNHSNQKQRNTILKKHTNCL